MSAVRLVVALWGGLYLVLGPLQSPGDGDLWWERWLGDLVLRTHHLPSALGPETFTSNGSPWVPQEWAFSVLVALAADHSVFWILALVVSAVPTIILVSIYLRSRAKASPQAIAIVLILCGLALGESFGIRAQVIGWACFALFLWALDRSDNWFYATVPIVAIWANFHASVMLAPAVLLARIVGAALDGGVAALRSDRDVRILPLIVLAVFCTPLGWRLPVYAVTFVTNPILRFIEEERSIRFSDLAFVFGSLPIALLLLVPNPLGLVRRKVDALPLLMLFFAMISTARNIPLFAILAAPIAAQNLDLAVPRLRKLGARIREMEPAALGAICLVLIASAFLFLRDQRHEPQRLPVAAVSSLAGSNHHHLLCQNFAWCSIALQFPDLQVYIDGRADPYPLDVWKSYVSTITLGPLWKQTLRRYGVDAVVALRKTPFASALAQQPEWHKSFEDQRYVVYVRG